MNRRNWMAAGLAGAALLAGTATGARAQAPAGAPPTATPPAAPAAAKPPAVVNGEVITKAELDDAVKKVVGPTPVQATEDQRRAQTMQILAVLIDNKLMHQFIAKNMPPAAPADVTARVASFEALLKSQNKTSAEFYKETGQTEATLRAELAVDVQMEAYAKSKISDADVEKYYNANKDYFDRVQVRASHIVLPIPPNATDADKAKLKQQLANLRAMIVANQIDFAEAAKKYSQCPTAAGGGDIGYINAKDVDDAFSRAAFSTPVNGVTDVVQSGYGFHLIKVTDRKAGEPSDFAKIKDDVRRVCMQEMYMNLLDELRKAGKIEITLP